MSQNNHLTESLYTLLQPLPRFNHLTPRNLLPPNGIYIFFENQETIGTTDRIVRVGTQKKDGRFKNRIRQHYGYVNSLKGNKNGSIFRKHLGGALLRKDNPSDPRLKDWLKQDGPTFIEVEENVSRVLRGDFTFSCFTVDSPEERLSLEKGLIALLAQFPLGEPSATWLGSYASSEDIRRCGLWNTQHINAQPLTLEEFQRVEQLVNTTMEGLE